MTQAEVGQVVGTTRTATISNWEREGGASRGDLRLLADLCVNDREVYAWLVEGGTMPRFLRIPPGAASTEGWRGELRRAAARLRQLADELDPGATPAESDARQVVVAAERRNSSPGAPAPGRAVR